MAGPEPDDTTFDLGGLPGGDILFTDPTAASYAGPSPPEASPRPRIETHPTAPSPVVDQRVPAPLAAPPAARPRAPRATSPARQRPTSTRRLVVRGAWLVAALLIWVVPVWVSTSHDASPPSTSEAGVEAPVRVGDMTVLRPHSVNPRTAILTVHIEAPTSGTYTITDNGAPVAEFTTAGYDHDLDPTVADHLLVAASDDANVVKCEVRDARGNLLATGEGTGILDCAYDPEILLE